MKADAKKVRGVFEKVPSSGVWWIRYAAASGRIRREKVGPKGAATQLYQKRKTEVRQRKKLPENFRAKAVLFSELADDALEYSRVNKPLSHRNDLCRMAKIREHFANREAEEITPQELGTWFGSHERWRVATRNRYVALVKLAYRLAEASRKIKSNPARLVRMRKENNARVRYLNQYEPLKTKIGFLKGRKTEEERLRAVISKWCPERLLELEVALQTGLRKSEQYRIEKSHINFERRVLTVPSSKHGEMRHVPLNETVLATFKRLLTRSAKSSFVFVAKSGDERLHDSKHWFEDAVCESGVRDFTWHDLRHTFASRLVMAGVDLRTTQELMGHKTIQMTCRYAHLAPAHQLAAVEKLAAYRVPVSKGRRQRFRRARLTVNTGSSQSCPTGTRTSTGQIRESETQTRRMENVA
jgi:site-specific recombinase XerD